MRLIALFLIFIGSALIISSAILFTNLISYKCPEDVICADDGGSGKLFLIGFVMPFGSVLVVIGVLIRYMDKKRTKITEP